MGLSISLFPCVSCENDRAIQILYSAQNVDRSVLSRELLVLILASSLPPSSENSDWVDVSRRARSLGGWGLITYQRSSVNEDVKCTHAQQWPPQELFVWGQEYVGNKICPAHANKRAEDYSWTTALLVSQDSTAHPTKSFSSSSSSDKARNNT
eukprot:scaffold3955_cov160-Cylindrotheca_fusiformis.AAC.1